MNNIQDLFKGLPTAHGQHVNGRSKTIRKPVEDRHWDDHIKGKKGIGIVPILADGMSCQFGAIDIDINTVDHSWLYRRVKELNYPLVVCRSKSGGAHLYTFTKKPVRASILRKALSGYAAKLGFGDSEIFPKQDSIKEGDVGNWINIPYFGAECEVDSFEMNRFAVNKDGNPLPLALFVMAATKIAKSNPINKMKLEDSSPDGMPPCLMYYYHNKVEQGGRNEILYMFGVFLRKSDVSDLEQELMKINYTVMDPPLPAKEVKTILGSVMKTKAHYKCKDPLFKLHCDSLKCRKMKFGVGDFNEEDYDEHMVGCLTKHLTDPPRWVIDINGVDLELSTEELMNYTRVRIATMERANIVAPPMKGEEWLLILKDRLENVRVVEAPKDASLHGDLVSSMMDFAQMSERSRNGREDLFRGIPVKGNLHEDGAPVIYFRSQDLISHLRRRKTPINLVGNALWMALRSIGCGHVKIKVAKRALQVWYVHTDQDSLIPLFTAVDSEAEI